MSELKKPVPRRRASLLGDLRSGDAGPGVRVFVSLALCSLLGGLAMGTTCFLAAISPASGRPGMRGGRLVVSMQEEVL